MRAHCLEPTACTAAKPTSHCRRCLAIRNARDPEINARRVAALRAKFADPAYVNDPKVIATRRANGQRQAREVLQRPDVRARSISPAAIAKRSRTHSNRRLAWCPIEYRADYRLLTKKKQVPPAEARRMIEAQIEVDRQRWLESGELQQSRRAA